MSISVSILTCARCGTSERRRNVHYCHWDSDRREFKLTLCEDCCESEDEVAPEDL